MNVRVLRKVFQTIELQAYPRVLAQSRRGQDREHTLVPPGLFPLQRLPSPPRWRFLDLRRVSVSSELKSLLLRMCIEVPESITNFLSSCNFEVGASIALASTGAERITLMRLALLSDPSRWTLSSPNFFIVPCAFGEFFGAI